MSEQSRRRFLFLKNKLEELNWKYGPLPDEPLPDWLDHTDAEPTWGPVGSLAKQWFTEQHINWLLEMDRDMGRHAPKRPQEGPQAAPEDNHDDGGTTPVHVV